ncbi:ScbA/BarX family gamma-butyrolactone biosynthesis protein [Streptomyces sp. NPDC012888]|uniref:ScbA/BarX family gamma-butyrolactone biosynthesis protein n=1 Tax=Streptomyces sp. NPDC012888 TaxID=3364855 RepID=UPI0036862A4C
MTTRLNTADAKQYVGKRRLREALVVGWEPVDDSTQTVGVEWPAHHEFYTPTPWSHSPLLVAESLRQALTLICHMAYGVPTDHRISWERMRLDVNPAALRTTGTPARAELRVTHSSVARRPRGTGHFTGHVEATVDGIPAGSGRLSYVTLPGSIYDRLRGPRADAARAFAAAPAPAEPVPPARVDRTDPRDVTVSPTDAPDVFELRVDTSHPVLFDHPHDHVPGMVLLEAAVQAARASAPGPLAITGFDTAFERYVEFDEPCRLTVAPAPRGLEVTGHQSFRRVFTALLTTA